MSKASSSSRSLPLPRESRAQSHTANGHANGHATNGHATNGHAANGHASNGHADAPTNGHTNGHTNGDPDAPKNGHANGRPSAPRSLPVIQDGPRARSAPAQGGETQLRYWLASLVRVSDNIVLKVVGAYNRMFELKSEDQADIYLQMAREFERAGKSEDLLEALRKAVQLRPRDGKIRVQIGILHLKSKRPGAAIEAFQKARHLGYSSYRLHLSWADALSLLGKHEAAIEEYQRALELNPRTPDALHKLGIALDRVSRFTEAAAAFKQATELVPHDVVYHQCLGFALESAGRRSDAVKCFKRALQLEQTQQDGAE